MLEKTNPESVELKSVSWLWDHRVGRGMFTLIEGDEEGLVALDLAARLSAGTAMPGEEAATCGPSKTMFLTCGAELYALRSRLQALDAKARKVEVFEEMLTIPDDLDALESGVRESGAVLLVIDPLLSYLGVSLTNVHAIRKALVPLVKMAARLDVAVIGVLPFIKQRGALAGMALCSLVVGPDPDDESAHVLATIGVRMSGVRPSMRFRFPQAGDDEPRIRWGGACSVTFEQLRAGPQSEDERDARGFLMEELANGERPCAELYREAAKERIAARTLRRAKKDLGIKGRKAWFWPEKTAKPMAGTTTSTSSQRPVPPSPFGPPQAAQEETRPIGQSATPSNEREPAEQAHQLGAGQELAPPEATPTLETKKGKRIRYHHHRSPGRIRAHGLQLKIPREVLNSPRLLKSWSMTPTAQGYKDAEELIVKVKAAKAKGQDPAPLWASYLPKRSRSPIRPPASDPVPSPKKSGGYVHHRSRQEILKEGLAFGIPAEALKNYRLLKDGVKPTKQGYLAAEELIAKVKAARAAGQDPAPLWARYLPPPAAEGGSHF